ncbi:unnamed protein product [Victoria cruziana]
MQKPFLVLSLLVLTLNIIHAPSQGAQAPVNIACGCNIGSFLDVYGNQWICDENYGGARLTCPGSIGYRYSIPADPSLVSTLRYFPSSCCYIIDAVRPVTVTAIFQYGNYDGMSSPPIFFLRIDDSAPATVQTSLTTSRAYTWTSSATPPAGTVSVCVDPGSVGYPFLSAIRIFPADSSTYGNDIRNDTAAARQLGAMVVVIVNGSGRGGRPSRYLLLLLLLPAVVSIVYIKKKNDKKKAEAQAASNSSTVDGAQKESAQELHDQFGLTWTLADDRC